MTKLQFRLISLFFASLLFVIFARCPEYLSDRNKFLADYVNQEMINFFGLVTAIVIPTIGLYLRRVTEITDRVAFRPDVDLGAKKLKLLARLAAGQILFLFALALLVVFVKGCLGIPPFDGELLNKTLDVYANTAAIVLHIWLLLLLMDVVDAFFEIDSEG